MNRLSVRFVALMALLLLPLLATQCYYDAPDYSDTPRISFNRVEKPSIAGGNDPVSNEPLRLDQLRMFVDFQDGDGNLGFSENSGGDSQLRSFYNFFADLYLEETPGQFELITFSEFGTGVNPFAVRFQRLDANLNAPAPIDGTLQVNTGFIPVGGTQTFATDQGDLSFEIGQRFYLGISIVDRETNVSNIVLTDTLTWGVDQP